MKIPKTAIGFMLLIGLAYAQPWYAASTRSIEYAIGTVRLMPHIETCSRDMVAAKAKEFRCIATSDLQERLLLVVAILEKAKASRSKWLFLGSSSGIEGALARWAVFGGISERGHGSSQNVAMGLAAARLLTTGVNELKQGGPDGNNPGNNTNLVSQPTCNRMAKRINNRTLSSVIFDMPHITSQLDIFGK